MPEGIIKISHYLPFLSLLFEEKEAVGFSLRLLYRKGCISLQFLTISLLLFKLNQKSLVSKCSSHSGGYNGIKIILIYSIPSLIISSQNEWHFVVL
jgi:hypothetical protein